MSDQSTQALIGHIYADAVTRQIPSEPMKVTKHSIEDGSIISEHIAEDNNTLTLECTFTDDVYSFAVPAGVAVATTTTSDDKRKAVYKMKRDRKIFNIETMKDRYENMALTDIQEDIDHTNAKAFVATLFFEKVRTATSKMTTVTLARIKKKIQVIKDAGLKQEPTQDQGQQPPEDVGEDPQAAAVVDGLFGAVGVPT